MAPWTSAARRCEEALEGADVCFLCAPVAALPELARATLAAGGDCVVTDVGSTKRAVLESLAASGLPEDDLARFVGGHPLAGAEASGVEHARAELFEGATWYLTPTERTSGMLLRAPLPGDLGTRRAARGDRRRSARPRDGDHQPRPARARERARESGRPLARGRRAAAAGDRAELS